MYLFSTSHAFQGMESKIIILTDPLTSPIENHKINEADYSNSKDLKNLITYNAMGRQYFSLCNLGQNS